MKLHPTLKLGLTLLALILGTGAASAWCGLRLGTESLKGVSQPEVSPAKKLAAEQETASQPQEPQEFVPVSEQEILKKVEKYLQDKSKPEPAKAEKASQPKPPPEAEETSSSSPAEKVAEEQKTPETNPSDQFPLQVQDGGVTLAVTKATQEGTSLILEVNLSNQGAKAVQFLYSFLEVKDEQGQALSAITEGLPAELPAGGQTFSGTIRLPAATLENPQKLSLNLTDYPDQKLRLSLANIPTLPPPDSSQ
jgi:hypothetical protein